MIIYMLQVSTIFIAFLKAYHLFLDGGDGGGKHDKDHGRKCYIFYCVSYILRNPLTPHVISRWTRSS